MASIAAERWKLLATALNNLGVASIVTGGIAPAAAAMVGTLAEDDPWRLSAVIVIWISIGVVFMLTAHRVLQELE